MIQYHPLKPSLRYAILATTGIILAVVVTYNAAAIFIGFLLFIAMVLGCSLGSAAAMHSGPKYTREVTDQASVPFRYPTASEMDNQPDVTTGTDRVVVSHNLDLAIEEVLQLILRDFVLVWYEKLGKDKDRLKQQLRSDMWCMVERLAGRMQSIDMVSLVTRGVLTALTDHFRQIRLSDTSCRNPGLGNGGGSGVRRFSLHAYQSSAHSRHQMAVNLVEVILIYTLPREHARCDKVRKLLTHMFTSTVWLPLVSWLCDPDEVNRRIHAWLTNRERLAIAHQRTYSYAANYEQFVDMISTCSDLDHLRQIRYNIISEIMQATTIQNLKRAKGLDTDSESSPRGRTKGHLLKARNLKRYMNQLTVAKSCCEKRLSMLGDTDETMSDGQQSMPGKTVMVFSLIMSTHESRSYFMKYLRKTHEDSMLRFWTAVESMRLSHKKHWHQMAVEVFQSYVAQPNSDVRQTLSRSTVKSMEAFMLGNEDADSFWDAQEQVYQRMEEHHYPSFIVSDIYHHYINQVHSTSDASYEPSSEVRLRSSSMKSPGERVERPPRVRCSDVSTPTLQQLAELDAKINNKNQAVHALRKSQKNDAKMLKLQDNLQDEIEVLKTERRQLEFHVERTELWVDNMGHWTAHICNYEFNQEGDQITPLFVVVVHLPGGGCIDGADKGDDTQGWVISRKLSDFHQLHKRLVEIQPSMKEIQLPQVGKFRFKSPETGFLSDAKDSLNDYLALILKDDHLIRSEPLFMFFSPSPEHLKRAASLSVTKPKFSLAGLLKSSNHGDDEADDKEELIFGEEDSRDEGATNVSVEPLYELIGEVFELRGVFKWLRRTLMLSVQTTFGRSINRHLQETINWTFSQPMLVYYIHLIRDACWPNGKLADKASERTDAQKIRMRLMAKGKCLENIPDLLKTLVGEENARRGTVKVFEALQDARLNEHLFYVLVEKFMCEMFPELKGKQNDWQQREFEETAV